MAVIWTAFEESPDLDRFQTLKAHAARASGWPRWRDKAVALLRARHTADRNELVRVFLWERNVDAAWREAVAGGCSPDLWTRLAEQRGAAHPSDALPIYQKAVKRTLARTNNQAYREAIGLLRQVRDLMSRAGRKNDFAAYLGGIRATHRAKRNFVKLLDHARWTPATSSGVV